MYFGRYPGPWLLTAIVLVVTAVPIMLLIHRFHQFRRKPAWTMVVAVLWGGPIALTMAIYGNTYLLAYLERVMSPAAYDAWSLAIAAPVVEEPIKAAGIVLLFLLSGRRFRSPLDGLVYGSAVGFGFQAAENVLYSLTAASASPAGARLTAVLTSFAERIFLSGILSHTLYTGLIGFGFAYALARSRASWRRRIGVPVLLAAVAWAGHFLVNSPLGARSDDALTSMLVCGGATVAAAALFLAVILILRHGERMIFSGLVHREVGSGALDPHEVAILLSLPARLLVPLRAARERGGSAFFAVRRLQREQVKLVLAHAPEPWGAPHLLDEQRSKVLELKAQLVGQAAA